MLIAYNRLQNRIRVVESRVKKSRGFSLLELLVAIAIVATLASLAFSSYREYRVRTDRLLAAADIASIQSKITNYFVENMELPESLDSLGLASMRDPWGSRYVYVNLMGQKGNGGSRKNKNLVPINTDYDLYSKGPDKESRAPLTAKVSKDDIIRANNGGFIGLAEDY